MNRAILQACLPCLLALMAAFVAGLIVVRCSGARWQWRKLRDVHGCQQGGVQSLSFVLTMPLFIMIVLFIVQVSQLMIATIVVNYAAYAAARSAIVWIPAEIQGGAAVIDEAENVLPIPAADTNPALLVFRSPDDGTAGVAIWEYASESTTPRSAKYVYIFTAAAMACSPLAPSRDLGFQNGQQNSVVSEAAYAAYTTLAPATADNPRLRQRIENKIAYSFMNTAVRVQWVDRDSPSGPTYNPRVAVREDGGEIIRDSAGGVIRSWRPNEVGWEDPVTVTVTHEFVLLPGPGRFLARFLVRADGQPDRVSSRINWMTGSEGQRIYTTPIWATITLTNEGLKSVLPYIQDTN